MAQKLSKKSSVKIKPVKSVVAGRKNSQATPKEFFSGLGRRKSAVARVRLWSGKQEIVVNGKPISTYFKGDLLKKVYNSPFVLTETMGKFTGSVKIAGSGLMSQADAFVHGVARALAKVDAEGYKKLLRDGGLLTRDPRMKETRKAGQGGRARAKKQSPKR